MSQKHCFLETNTPPYVFIWSKKDVSLFFSGPRALLDLEKTDFAENAQKSIILRETRLFKILFCGRSVFWVVILFIF